MVCVVMDGAREAICEIHESICKAAKFDSLEKRTYTVLERPCALTAIRTADLFDTVRFEALLGCNIFQWAPT